MNGHPVATVVELELKADLEEGLVVLDGLGDGHLDAVAEALGRLVGGSQLRHRLLCVGKTESYKKPTQLNSLKRYNHPESSPKPDQQLTELIPSRRYGILCTVRYRTYGTVSYLINVFTFNSTESTVG